MMKNKGITLIRGDEPLLDYLKGIAILMVLLNHGTGGLNGMLQYPLWVEQAVPIFLLIQVFHAYKKDAVVYPKLPKIWHRILKPFLVIQSIFLVYTIGKGVYKGLDLSESLTHMLYSGGSGPGSYYIWVYIQMAILCPLMYRLATSKFAVWIFAGISLGMEIMCSTIEMPDDVYRLLCIRYVFLIYLGYLWAKKGILLTTKTICLSILSAAAILVLNYAHQHQPVISFEPWVFDTDWTSFHWFTYFLPWSFLPFVICKCYQIKPECRLNKLVLLCGKRSYEIFLWQMLVFGVSSLPGYANILVSLLPLVVCERGKCFSQIKM